MHVQHVHILCQCTGSPLRKNRRSWPRGPSCRGCELAPRCSTTRAAPATHQAAKRPSTQASTCKTCPHMYTTIVPAWMSRTCTLIGYKNMMCVQLCICKYDCGATMIDPGRTRTCNLWFRRPTPYPLGHRALNGRLDRVLIKDPSPQCCARDDAMRYSKNVGAQPTGGVVGIGQSALSWCITTTTVQLSVRIPQYHSTNTCKGSS